MSRIGVWSKFALTVASKQGYRHNVSRCLSSICNRRILQRIADGAAIDAKILKPTSNYHVVMNVRFYSDGKYPKHSRVVLPALSPTMEMGTIVSWAKKEGDKLNEGDLLAEIETDKATMGFETPEEGYLAKILVSAGSRDVPIGKLVCVIVENQEDVAAFKDFKDDGKTSVAAGPPRPSPSPPKEVPPAAPPSMETPVIPSSSKEGRVSASPMARRLAEAKNIRLEALGKGSGLYGSVTAKDLEKAPAKHVTSGKVMQKGVPPKTPYTDKALTNMRLIIAKRLKESKLTIPHYYLTVDVCVDEILRIRNSLNKTLEKSGVKISINDFIIKATALASKKVPEANSSWMDTVIREYKNVDVSVAVSTEKGLITPIVFQAESKGLVEISNTIRALAKKAREGTLKPHEFQGGTISVSNLGMYGITHFSAIINPPQSCILAVGTLQERMVPSKTSEHGVRSSFISVTLSCDHRVVDGAVGAQWLSAFREFIEAPNNMLL